MIAAGTTSLITATASSQATAQARARARHGADGTPEQVHLTWDDDPARTVVVSWASPGQAARPRLRIGQRVIFAAGHPHADPLSGAVTWSYHARVDGLRPGATYGYAVTADNDGNAADPFSAMFTTAAQGRTPFRFTAFGDVGAHSTDGQGQAASAVAAVETFQPLFHLLNADLADVQASAAHRPWLPVPSEHEPDSFRSRYALPASGADAGGRWYSFRVGTAVFLCLSGDEPGGAQAQHLQTQWLESTLATARADASVDWIIASVHRPPGDSGGARPDWLPLFEAFEVDLVLSGHDHGYQRSFPVPDSGAAVDTSQGTVHLALGTSTGGRTGAGAAGPGADAHGIAVCDVNPGHEVGGQTSITVRYYHAIDPDDYAHLETFTLTRPRSDGRRWHPRD
jgi:hypothetical protein